MDTRARHLIAEYWGCDTQLLDDEHRLEVALRQASDAAGCTLLGALRHRFDPQGASVALLLAESHASIHTWPEHGYAAVDLYTCSPGDPMAAHASLRRALGAGHAQVRVLERGAAGLDLDAALADAAARLRSALTRWWPGRGDHNEVSEATPLLHLAHALEARGLTTYAEVPLPDKQHLDLVAVGDGPRPVVVLVEGKRLYSAEQAQRMADDWGRMTGVDALPPGLPAGAAVRRLILGTTWEPEHQRWWAEAARPDAPTSKAGRPLGGQGWRALGGALAEAEGLAVHLTRVEASQRQWLIGAHGPVPAAP